AIAQNAVGKMGPRVGRGRSASTAQISRRLSLRPVFFEGNKTSSGVGLQIVVIGEFRLPARDEGVPSMDLDDSRQEVVLCVFVRNRTLSLAATNQPVGNSETGRQGSSLYAGDCGVVRRRKKFLCHIEPGIDRYTEVAETAGTDIQVR